MRVSVIVNTLNRACPLELVLDALEHLEYEDFEVIVINGPSTDGTAAVLERRAGRIKVATCAEPNLAQSRNIGIAMAAGDVVAFIDDDAYPDPVWLNRLVEGYDSDEIAAVGGPVLNHTGTSYQVRYLRSNRYGDSVSDTEGVLDLSFALSVPGAAHFPSLLGTNSSFRRSTLVEMGGFDEEYEYFLDETDVCVRLVDRGLVVRTLDDGIVFHKFLPSNIRRGDRVARVRYSVIKNGVYFALRHARPNSSFAEVCQGVADFVRGHRKEMQRLNTIGVLDDAELGAFEQDVERGSNDGFQRALRPPRTRPARIFADPPAFLRYSRRLPAKGRLRVAFVSIEAPPGPVNGIGRLFTAEAMAMADRGHEVHLVTAARDHDTVDFEDRVWVHRYRPESVEPPVGVPAAIWAWASTARRVVDGIHARRRLDVVVVPSWDSEGLAMLDDRPCPVVLGVYTPLPTVIRLDPGLGGGDQFLLSQLMAAERRCVQEADFILASGPWTVAEIERGHGVTVAEERRLYAPHGLADRSPGVKPERPSAGLHVLYVGRLELRKGVDVLLRCVPRLLERFPDLVISLAGEDVAGMASKYLGRASHDVTAHVRMLGRVDDERLDRLYAGCDVFVAPSRYESFGLILIEAMMFGKPVVAGDVGGMRSIVDHGVTGLLVEAGNRDALLAALSSLLSSAEDRAVMGAAGRARYEERYTDQRMAEQLEAALRSASTV